MSIFQSKMTVITETKLLQLRSFAASDDHFVLTLLNTPSWLKFIGDRKVRTLTDAQRYIMNNLLKMYKEQGYGAWVVVLKETNTPIGICGLFKRRYLEHPDLGFAFLPSAEGKGYAYEITKATLEYSQQELKLPLVYAITQPENQRSVNLLNRLGFAQHGTIQPPGEDSPLSLFRKLLFEGVQL
ncbi:N-acetyltransferase [Chitinophaga silvatica]|uniref:N-acetyltransferase n=1 Tax=Chitinophaga silvatica TaxID=2282649 RepID=A0A3E1Y908_9BACT|nr:GNAT family N-acetyltransferase [Chitinophaga silvatica]RFS21831.1 N-acetyltransferase [Chitinophaga silvatica]